MHSRIRFGIIGCSSIAERSTLPAMIQTKQAKLQMIGSRSLKKAKKFSKKFSCNLFGNYEEVLEHKDVDAVYISLPIGLQEKWAIKAAKAGKHILCEKSVTTSYNSAKKIVSECKKNEIRILEAFAFRFHPQHKKIKKIIQQDKLGKLFSFYGKFGFLLSQSSNDFRLSKKLGGGSLNDIGCYLVCANRILLQEPISITCRLVYNKKFGVDMKGVIFFEYSKNRIGIGIFSYENIFQSTYELCGLKGCVNLEWAFNIRKNVAARINLQTNTSFNRIRLKPTDQFELMIKKFCKELNESKTSEFNFENDLLSQARVLEAARKSNSRKKSIHLSD